MLTTSGSLDDFPLPQLLQSLGQSRHGFQVTLYRSPHEPVGLVAVKAGYLTLSAAEGGLTGNEAFRFLCGLQRGLFRITRSEPAGTARPIGRLANLLMSLVPGDLALSTRSPEPAPSEDREEITQSLRVTPVPGSDDENRPSPSGAAGPVSIAIVSPKGGVGKTTVSLNLANALAAGKRRVLLVDGGLNGDLLSALDGKHSRRRGGLLEVFYGNAALPAMLMPTANPNPMILPAFGLALPIPEQAPDPGPQRWRMLLEQAASLADLVLVDTPAGLFGRTLSIMSASTHVLGVVQAEPLAARLSDRFARVIDSLSQTCRPHFLGLVVNMLQSDCESSVDAFHAVTRQNQRRLFRTCIPRDTSILDASRIGQPLKLLRADALAALFDDIARELSHRLSASRFSRSFKFLS